MLDLASLEGEAVLREWRRFNDAATQNGLIVTFTEWERQGCPIWAAPDSPYSNWMPNSQVPVACAEVAFQPFTQPSLASPFLQRPLGLNAAENCTHLLHPGLPQTMVLCPVCTVQSKLESLRSYSNIWTQYGGPTCDGEQKGAMYWKVCRVWHSEKASFLRLMFRMEEWEEQERDWEQEHAGVLELSLEDIKSAKKALNLTREQTSSCERTESGTDARPQYKEQKKISKGVSWDTNV